MVTHNRLDLTKQAVASYLETVHGPWSLEIVDNASTDGTQEWLLELVSQPDLVENTSVTLLRENRYPGFATNRGWETAPDRTVLLHRADNDFVFLPGWELHVRLMFSTSDTLGQLGLRTNDEELHNPRNVGGNCVIRKELWDQGLRYDERTWPEISAKVPGYTEDSFMSPKVVQMGWTWGRVTQPCIRPISQESADDPYYRQTWADRGIHH
jgi:glycosyltransferase involved in cell wall biosynthesis